MFPVKEASQFLAGASLARHEAGILLKLLVHPEYEVRGAALTVLAAAVTSPVSAQDLYALLLGEQHPACLEQLLLICCASLQAPGSTAAETPALGTTFSEDNLAFLLSMVHTAVNDGVAAAALR